MNLLAFIACHFAAIAQKHPCCETIKDNHFLNTFRKLEYDVRLTASALTFDIKHHLFLLQILSLPAVDGAGVAVSVSL